MIELEGLYTENVSMASKFPKWGYWTPYKWPFYGL